MKKRISLICLFFTLLVGSFYFYLRPQSQFVMNNDPRNSLWYDFFHYEDLDVEVIDANFNVLSFDLEITVRNQLDVVAKIILDEILPEYRFTLYHRYQISKITNENGDHIDFIQEGDFFTGDFFTINNQGNESIFVVHYVGYSPTFYSNSQGMMLLGFFPFIPIPGQQLIYDMYLQTFSRILLEEVAHFDVRINKNLPVFSNLTEISPNHFEGYSNSLTLMSGLLRSTVAEGIKIVYPFLNFLEHNETNFNYTMSEFRETFSYFNDVDVILIIPNMNLHSARVVMHENHITTPWLWELADSVYDSFINPRKFSLHRLIDLYQNDRRAFLDYMTWGYDNAIMMNVIIQALGEDTFFDLAFHFIHNDYDKRVTGEFLFDLVAEYDLMLEEEDEYVGD